MDDLFKGIKQFDRVLIPIIHNSLYTGKYNFSVGVVVTRVTATQFSVDNRKYRKSDGKEVGQYCYASLYDEAKDDTKEYRAHLKRVAAYCHLIKKIQNIKLPEYSKITDGQLENISDYADTILDMLSGKLSV